MSIGGPSERATVGFLIDSQRDAMNKDRIGVGLIGLGRHGMRYARHLVNDLPMASLRAVCRRHPEQGFELSNAGPVTIHGTAASLIADPTVDVVVVVTPPVMSPQICRLAVEAHKPLLIEKPLAAAAEDAQAMVAFARDASVPLMTAQTLRFDSTIQELQKLRHRIGRFERLSLISKIETKANAFDHADGYGKRGAVLEIGVHMLDLVRFLIEEEVQALQCTMDRIPPVAQETTASVHLRTQSGTVCEIEIARVSVGRVGRVEWTGSRGRLEADWIQGQVRCIDDAGTDCVSLTPSQTVLATLLAFLQAVRTGTPMPITGEDGWRAVELAEACYRSAQADGASVALSITR